MASDVVDGLEDGWESEPIPDEDFPFMRVHKTWLKRDGTISLGVFKNTPTPQDGMSTDWQKYSTPEETRSRTARKPLDEYAVIRMLVGNFRTIPKQEVEYTPLPDNRAHTDVFGEKDEEARLLFGRIYEMVIGFDGEGLAG
jgi:hypothetical protein